MFEDHLLRKWLPSGHPGAPFPASSKPEAASSAIALAVSCDTIDMGTLSQLWRLGQVTNEWPMNCRVFSTWFHHRLLIEMASSCFNFHPLQQSKHSWDIHFPRVFLWFSHFPMVSPWFSHGFPYGFWHRWSRPPGWWGNALRASCRWASPPDSRFVSHTKKRWWNGGLMGVYWVFTGF